MSSLNGHARRSVVRDRRVFACPVCAAELPIPATAPNVWRWSCVGCGRRGELNLGWKA